MDIADESIVAFWKLMAKHNVRYIMIGGFATNLHGFNRTTADIDIYLEDTLQNRDHFGTALEEAGIAPRQMIQTMEFIPGWSTVSLDNGFPLDIMTSVKGLEELGFAECLANATIAIIEGAEVPFLNINHLIRSKKAANRPKDQIDILELEKISRLNGEEK